MKRQNKIWSCAAASVRNAARGFGERIGENTIRGLAATTKDGTGEDGIINALRELGYTAVPYSTNVRKDAWNWLWNNVLRGKRVILCIDCWEHWVVVLGLSGDTMTIFDSSNFKYNVAENGTHCWKKDYLLDKWRYARKKIPEGEGEHRYYAIAVGEKKK